MEQCEKDEIEKVKKKVPEWFKKPDQINSKILTTFLKLKNGNRQVTVKILQENCSEIAHFMGNYNQMKNFGERNHAKVFEEETNYTIELWEPVKDFIIKEFEKIGKNQIAYSDTEYTEEPEQQIEPETTQTNILIKSPKEAKEVEALLNKDLPNYRQAYSDRTSWLMACISELAYVKFNPLFKNSIKDYFIEKVSKLLDENRKKSLEKLIELVDYNHEDEKEKLEENAEFLNLKLVETFDKDGTQAIFLENDNYIFLGFRGTEATSIKDIKSDANAVIKACETGGKVHSGFDDAFNQVYIAIDQLLSGKEYENKPLFITGHSLGGALATIATKKLTHEGGIAACYTFGSPKVGDADWIKNIKTPIYRVVNAADPVTMLPPGIEIISFVAWLSGWIPHFGGCIKSFLLSKFNGYFHTGDMRYLTNCKAGDHKDVKLLYAVSWWFRIVAFWNKKRSLLKMPADHSISIYRNKLKIIATNRNNKTTIA